MGEGVSLGCESSGEEQGSPLFHNQVLQKQPCLSQVCYADVLTRNAVCVCVCVCVCARVRVLGCTAHKPLLSLGVIRSWCTLISEFRSCPLLPLQA